MLTTARKPSVEKPSGPPREVRSIVAICPRCGQIFEATTSNGCPRCGSRVIDILDREYILSDKREFPAPS